MTLVAELLNPGGALFQRCRRVFVSQLSEKSNQKPTQNSFNLSNSIEVPLVDDPQPLGGKWGQATRVLLPFTESQAPQFGSWISLPRDEFPPLADGEFYLCDVMGAEVRDEHNQVQAQVVSFDDFSIGAKSSIVIEVQNQSGQRWSFPSSWIESVALDEAKPFLKVPGISEWKLNPADANDEDSDADD